MRCGRLVIAALLAAAPAWAQTAPPPGASLDDLLARARAMSPETQISALETEAARATIEGAGSLADPKLSLSVEDWGANRNGGNFPANPASGTTKKLRLSQELPFWGKRDLKREIAEANARKAAILERQVETDLVARVKRAYADSLSARQTIEAARDLRHRLDTLTSLARARYGQGQGKQQDVIRIQVEAAALEGEIVRMSAEQRRAQARLNRLLARPPEAPLADSARPRTIPPLETITLGELIERGRESNPSLAAEQAAIDKADKARALADKSWYPDVEIGVSSVKREGEWRGYEAMLSVNLPLRAGLRDAEIGEAGAQAAAARLRREQKALDLGNDIAESWIALTSAREVETLLRERQLPQAELGFQSAIQAYELGRTDLPDVILAEQQVWTSRIALIRARLDQQSQLAELEKLVGGCL